MAYHTTIHRFWQLKVYIQQQKKIIKTFNSLPPWLTIHKHEKTKLRAALWKYLNAYFLYPVDEVWAMCKVDVLCCFVKYFMVIYNVKMCMFVCSWLLPHPTVFVTHSWKLNLFVVAYTCLNVRIWALWCNRPLIMGNTEDISSSLLSTIIFSIAVLISNPCCKISCVFQIFFNEVSWFFFSSFIDITVFMSPQIKSYALGLYRCFKAFFTLFKNWLQSPVVMQRTVHRGTFLQWKPTRCTISQNCLIKLSTCFGQVHCPSSGVSQHCIHAIGICHASSVGHC
jgi:hypothetical protein